MLMQEEIEREYAELARQRQRLRGQFGGIANCLGVTLGVKNKGGCVRTRRGLGLATTGAGARFAVASLGTDLRNRISMRRRCGKSPGVPNIASVSSVFTSW